MAVSASAPASAMAFAIGPDVRHVRRQLHEQRQVRRAPDRGGHLASGAGVDRELETAPPDVRAADVELDAGDARNAVEAPGDLDVVLDRLARDVDDHRDLPAGPGAGVLLDDGIDARVLEADRVEHPARRLGDARRRVADPRPERGPLAADRAEPVDVDDLAVLDAVAERPRRDQDRVGEHEAAAEVDRQVDVLLGPERGRAVTLAVAAHDRGRVARPRARPGSTAGPAGSTACAAGSPAVRSR